MKLELLSQQIKALCTKTTATTAVIVVHTLAHTCTCNLISGPRPSRDTLIWARTRSHGSKQSQDMLLGFETCSYMGRDLLALLQTSFLGWSFPLTLALVIPIHCLQVKHTQKMHIEEEICINAVFRFKRCCEQTKFN